MSVLGNRHPLTLHISGGCLDRPPGSGSRDHSEDLYNVVVLFFLPNLTAARSLSRTSMMSSPPARSVSDSVASQAAE